MSTDYLSGGARLVFTPLHFHTLETVFPSRPAGLADERFLGRRGPVSAPAIAGIARFINSPERCYPIPSPVLQEADWILLFPKQLNVLQ